MNPYSFLVQASNEDFFLLGTFALASAILRISFLTDIFGFLGQTWIQQGRGRWRDSLQRRRRRAEDLQAAVRVQLPTQRQRGNEAFWHRLWLSAPRSQLWLINYTIITSLLQYFFQWEHFWSLLIASQRLFKSQISRIVSKAYFFTKLLLFMGTTWNAFNC